MTFNQMIRTLLRPCIVLATILFFLGNAAIASAQAPNFGIRPQEAGKGYFEYTIAAGETVQDVLVANNPNDAPLSLNIWTARGVTMAAGGITFAEDSSGPAQWITLSDAGIVEIPAQTTLNLPFEVAVPAGTPPGEYVAGFLARPEELPAATPLAAEGATGNESSFEVKVVSQVGVTVIITVPWANQCEAAISSLTSTSDKGRWQFAIGMQNTGNMHFNSTGEVIARPVGGGEPIAQKSFEVGYFIPGDTIEYPLFLEPYPTTGDYEIEVNLLTNCGFETVFTQPVSISEENVLQAAAQAQAEGQPSAASEEAAKIQAQAELIRSIGLLVGALVALIIVGIVVVLVLRRRKSA